MATGSSKQLFLCFFCCCCFISILNALSSEATPHEDFKNQELQREEEQILRSSRRTLNNLLYKTTEFDSINPVTTPALNSPPANQVPTVVTIPATVPNTNPVNTPIPATNPVTTPSTIPGGTPTPGGGVGQSWCIAKNGASQTALQAALDYACGIGKADCASIQQGTNCYNPNSLQNHASYAFNSYYQKNPVQTSCDFGGAAVITSTNPSSGSCIYPSSSSASSSSSPAVGNQTTITTPTPTPTTSTTPTPTPTTIPTTTPTTMPTTPPTPTTSSSSPPAVGTPTTISTPPTSSSSGSSPGGAIPGAITPPSVLNSSSGFPDSGTTTGFGATPPIIDSSSSSAPAALQPFVGCLAFVTFALMGRFIMHM